MNNSTTLTRENWLNSASELILDTIILPLTTLSRPLYRVSVGWPVGSRGSKNAAIGQCFNKASSKDLHNEIFIIPSIDDSLRVLDVLTHELIHAVDDCESGHRGTFAKLARQVGLEGKLTATVAGEQLAERLNTIIDDLGPIPHAALSTATRKKQKTRNIKVECITEGCDFKFNTSRAQIDNMTTFTCNCCQEESLRVAVPKS